MVYRHKRRKRFRRGRRRKGGFRKKVKRIVKSEFKKKIEMKYTSATLGVSNVSSTGSLTEHFDITAIIQGVLNGQRVGQHINLHKWFVNFRFLGPAGTLWPTPLRMRIIVCYSKRTVTTVDFPTSIDNFMDLELMKRNGIYVMIDRSFSLAPEGPTILATVDTYVQWCATLPPHRTWRKKFNLKGRKRSYDALTEITNGRLWTYAISEANPALATCRMGQESRLFYTDA